jgi:hypothetical protein
VRLERAPLLSSYFSSPTVGRCPHVWPIFSYAMLCFVDYCLPGSVLVSFKAPLLFFHPGFLPHFLVDFAPFFIPERIGLPPMVDRLALTCFCTLSVLQSKPRCPLHGSAS